MAKTSDVLLVIDLQKGVCHDSSTSSTIDRLESLTTLVNKRTQHFEQLGKPVIFIQHEDEQLIPETEEWELLPELIVPDCSYFVRKTHANAFFKTNLNKLLEGVGCRSIELCGAQTEYCVDATVKFAHGLGYHLSMSRGATTTYNNLFMTAQSTVTFYEKIWEQRFLTLQD